MNILPTVVLEGKKLPRIIFSLRLLTPSHPLGVSSVMRKLHEKGVWCFDLPSARHLESFRKLKESTGDETLTGLCHLEAENGVSFLGRPLHHFESKIFSTIRRRLALPQSIRNLPSHVPSSEVFTQREIDHLAFDAPRFERALSSFNAGESPLLLLGERYGEWLLALGRIDLLKEMVAKVREKGFIPIFSGQWATFSLPKSKPLDVAAYAVPINKKWSLFDHTHACNLIKKFDKPVISLNPLSDGELLTESEDAFSFLFNELKIYLAILEIASEEEAQPVLRAFDKFPSLIPRRKT